MTVRWVPLPPPQLAYADRAPTAADDRNAGARRGSRWRWEAEGREWECADDSPTAAVWIERAISGDVQPANAKLSAIAALDSSTGLIEQTGADAFAKRDIGVADGGDIPTRDDGDARWQGLDATLTALAALTWSAGALVPALVAADSFSLRAIGAASDSDLLDRAAADARYQPLSPRLWAATALPVLAAGELFDVAVLTRAQGADASTTLDSDGVTWAEAASDVARFFGAARRLRHEPPGGNLVANVRGEGGVVGVIGSGGAMPTNWGFPGGLHAGLTREVMGFTTIGGFPAVILRIHGTASAGNGQIIFSPTVTVTPGVAYTGSVFAAYGDQTALPDSAAMYIPNEAGTVAAAFSGAPDRFSVTRVVTGTPRRHAVYFTYTIGNSYDFEVILAAPQLEPGAYATTPILPPVGAPAASTRGAQSITAAIAGLDLAGSGAGVTIGETVILTAAGAVDQVVWQRDDGTDSNRIALINPAGGSTLILRRTTGGVAASTASLGSFVAGTPFFWGLSVDGVGGAAARVNSGSILTVAGAPTSLATDRLGDNAAGTAPAHADFGPLLVAPDVLGDIAFGALVAAGPKPLRYSQIAGAP